MEQLSRIESRLESLSELGDLVGALRSMAASRSREAREALAGTRAYCATVEAAIASIAPLETTGPSAAAADGSAVLIVLTSENGFVGGFNTRLVERAARVRLDDEQLFLVGRRGQVSADERGLVADHVFGMTSRAGAVTALARRIVALAQGTGAVRVLHADHRPGSAFEIKETRILPLEAARPKGAKTPEPPIIQMPPQQLLQQLAWEYLFAEIASALMQSLAAENVERLRTMDAASRNIEDRLDTLKRQERVARQEETTADMLDVVVGAEAVTSG
ncbi:F0F1 ATP synthase subunit gamma [Mameliella sp. CS4]|uniref:F0F1 ATP synthase subunit gamma n=1 Tax=Mameliella sp. CS4 TaxID=2862329 RepID=UPI001C5E1FA6|nr:FoF1 ATP synthase subunit gamma [Mameliella sp. CS4]MBW4982732.1 F0F1 ATP synthase subunit gamma [Mameliella sp. CS4]